MAKSHDGSRARTCHISCVSTSVRCPPRCRSPSQIVGRSTPETAATALLLDDPNLGRDVRELARQQSAQIVGRPAAGAPSAQAAPQRDAIAGEQREADEERGGDGVAECRAEVEARGGGQRRERSGGVEPFDERGRAAGDDGSAIRIAPHGTIQAARPATAIANRTRGGVRGSSTRQQAARPLRQSAVSSVSPSVLTSWPARLRRRACASTRALRRSASRLGAAVRTRAASRCRTAGAGTL